MVVKKQFTKKSSTQKDKNSKKTLSNKKAGGKRPPGKQTNQTELIDPYAIARGDKPMSVIEHLDELRSRLLICLLIIVILSCIALFFSEILLNYVIRPYIVITKQQLKIIDFQGPIMVRIKVSIIFALNLSIPIIIFHIWRFIMPAIDKSKRLFTRLALFSAIILFYAGIAFIFIILFPFTIQMLYNLVPVNTETMTSIDSYLSFLFVFSITMGLVFELPIIMLVLTKVGIITPQFLIAKRKYAIVLIWIIAAIITPADVLTQVAVACPLMLLYEVSIFIAKVIYRKIK